MKAAANIRSYAAADVFLNGLQSRKVAHNTYVERRPGNAIAIRYHATDVVLYAAGPGGAIQLNTGGWKTVTTKARFNAFAPVSVYSKKGKWFAGDVPFFDGINVAFVGNEEGK